MEVLNVDSMVNISHVDCDVLINGQVESCVSTASISDIEIHGAISRFINFQSNL